MDDFIFCFHGNFRWTGQPPVKLLIVSSGLFWTAFRPVQSHPLGFLDLNHAGIMHHDFHDAVAERFDVLDDKLQPLRITAAHGHFLLNLAHKYKRHNKSSLTTNKNLASIHSIYVGN